MIFIPVLAKQGLNVHWTVSIKRLTNAAVHAGVAIVDYSADGKSHSYVYNSLPDFTDQESKQKTFDESTEVYKNANAIYGADGFNSPVEVIEIPKNSNSSESASVSNGSITENSSNPIADAMLYELDSNVSDVVPTKNVSEKDVETITDTLMGCRGGVVDYQTASKDDMHAFASHIQSNQANQYGNAYGIFEDRPVYVAAQVAGYAYCHVPCDRMKIINQSEFEPTDLTRDEVKDVRSCNFNVIVDKADDFAPDTDLSVNGSYIDQFANVKYIVNDLTYVLQRFLNRNNTTYDDLTIHNIKGVLKTEIQHKLSGLFVGIPKVTVTSYAQVSPADVEKRVFRNATVSGEIYGDIEDVYPKLDLTA